MGRAGAGVETFAGSKRREIEQSRTIPAHVLDALHAAQMFRTVMPRSVGGGELDPATHAQVVAAIAEGDASVAWCIAQAACASMACAYFSRTLRKEIFGDPRAVFTFGYTRADPPCLALAGRGRAGGSTASGPSAAATGLPPGSAGTADSATRRACSSSFPTAGRWSAP